MPPNHELLHVEASAEIGAPVADVYRTIADYRDGHLRMVPPRYIRNLRVQEGGYGAGTIITFDVLAFGRTVHARARVSEPEPGRALMETDLDKGAETSFIVEALSASRSRVTIAVQWPTRAGLLGRIERAMIRPFLARLYAAELAQLNTQMMGRSEHAA